MARLTRQEIATAAGAGLLLGAFIALAGQILGAGLAVTLPLCGISAAGLGAFLAHGKYGTW